MPATVTNPPEGWTVAADEMRTDIFWGAQGRAPLQPRARDVGGDGCVFMSGDKIYLWNMLAGDVWEYVKPVDLNGILAEMRKPAGTGVVEVQLVKPAS
ncbi:hypothetical protein PG987_010105 [Apiospora arundinis]